MPTHDTSLNLVTALLKPESRCAVAFTLAALIVGAGSCAETTLEMTNRVCDRYFPLESGKTL